MNILHYQENEQNLRHFEILTDSSYHFQQILTNKDLNFKKTATLKGASAYWIRAVVVNPSRHAKLFELKVYPSFNSTLYHKYSGKTWNIHNSKFNRFRSPWRVGRHTYEIAGQRRDTIYVYVNVDAPNALSKKFKARLLLQPQSLVANQKSNLFTAWAIGMVVLLLFFLNNLYLYFNFKDKATAYYLILQLATMAYLTSYCLYFERLQPYTFAWLLKDTLNTYTIDKLAMHMAILIIFWGLINLCRSYLNTKVKLPGYDRLLKYSLNTYIVFEVGSVALTIRFFYIDDVVIIVDNILCLLLMLLVLLTSIKAYRAKVPNSQTFLLANCLPLLIMVGIPLYHLFIDINGHNSYWLPVIALAAQALSFSVALVSRTKATRDALIDSEIESRQLALSLEEIVNRNHLNEKEIEQAKTNIIAQTHQNLLLNQRLENHQRELAASTLFMVQKNELLHQLKTQINELKGASQYQLERNVDGMMSLLDNNDRIDTGWETFKIHFEQVHPSFFDDLKREHSTLTQKETRLSAYLKMQLSNKEIAVLMGIDQASVRRAKTRLLKKMKP